MGLQETQRPQVGWTGESAELQVNKQLWKR